MRKTMFVATVWATLSAAGLGVDPPPGDLTAKIPQIISFDPDNGIVIIRDTTTGRTMQFTADTKVVRTLRVGDWVEADMGTGRVTVVKGVAVAYRLNEPERREGCCVIAEISAAPRPSVGVVARARHKTTGRTFQFQVDEPPATKSLRVGQVVSMVDGTNAWVLVPSGPSSYSFRVR